MRIRVEPKDFFMYSVYLAFQKDEAEAEDGAVRAYLEEHELLPKLQGTDTVDGEEFDVKYFGGCYLGRHLGTIEEMQRKAVEREMLAEEIGRVLQESADPTTRDSSDGASGARLKTLIDGLAEEFHEDSSFAADDNGYLNVALEPTVIQQRFLERVGQET